MADGSFIAFSLNQAQELLKSNNSCPELFNLGGITRLAGMVADKQNNDIILIGQHLKQLPEARFDDFVVALRSRLIYDELPMVSIDPTANTIITGIQDVRFGGHIENTSFGNDMLSSDIILKKYSLELEKQIASIVSFRELLVKTEVNDLEKKGIKAINIHWTNPDSLNNFMGMETDAEKTSQSRFMFNYRTPCRVRTQGDVYCIMLMDICVEIDTTLTSNKQNIYDKSSAENQFAKMFTDGFYKIAEVYEPVRRLKLLFDMVAIANGIKNIKDILDMNYILQNYKIKTVETKKNYDLLKQCAIIDRSDGKTSLIQVSGGIEISTEMQFINGGNVGKLKEIVLKARPGKNSLYWELPIDDWNMPNSNGIDKKTINRNNRKNGFSLDIQKKIVYGNPGQDNVNGFDGFKKVASVDPFNTKGVQMKMIINDENIKEDTSLNNLSNQILKNSKKGKVHNKIVIN
ncbi:MAG TPA: hypothetical protein PKW80_00675 [Bacteroidales bacterium]|nr:hypothetical protein [Bacteroidales bacterium]